MVVWISVLRGGEKWLDSGCLLNVQPTVPSSGLGTMRKGEIFSLNIERV